MQENKDDLRQPLVAAESTSKPPPPKQVGFFQMFRYADGYDLLLMIFGSVAAVLTGTIMPLFAFFFGAVIDIFYRPDPVHQSLMLAFKFWVLAGAAWILNFVALGCWTITGERQSLRYRKIYYRLLLKQEVHWYDVNNPNELSTRVSTEITAIQGALGQKCANLISQSVMSVTGFFLAYFRNWRLSLVLSAILPAMVISGILLMLSMQKMSTKNTTTYSEAGASAEQAFSSIKTIKCLVGERFEVDRYVRLLDQARNKAWKYTIFVALSVGMMMFSFLGSYSLGFWYGKKMILQQGYTAADVLSTFFCIINGGGALGQVGPSLKNIAAGKAAIAKVLQLIERKPTLVEPKNGVKIDKIDRIEFQNVNFAYKKSQESEDPNVLNNVSFSVPINKVTALVGESGSGKSTIIQLVQRFYDPKSGTVLINGQDLKTLDAELYRQKIGYVGQEPALFSLSIRENMQFAKEGTTEDEIISALKQANAYEFVSKMDKGLDTFVGSSGAQISGGQKQRIAIARAILKDPSLFIFDEATSALDRKNQKLIQETLSSISQNRTTLVIAHRLSTVRNADSIIVLNKGRIVEQGTHDQLVANKSYYYDLVKNQMQSEGEGIVEAENEKEAEKEDIVAEAADDKGAEKIEETEEQKKEKAAAQAAKQKGVFKKMLVESKGEIFYYLIGGLCAAASGVIFPSYSFVLSRVMGYMGRLNPIIPDPDLNHDIDLYCLGFLGIATLSFLFTFGYHFSFGMIGEALVYNLRVKAFSKLMRMEVKYYDKQENNPGAISTKLAQDAYLIHNMTTGVLGVVIMNLATVSMGLSLAFYYNWRVSLVVIGVGPLLAIAGSIHMKRIKAYAAQADEAYKQAGNQISDSVCNIRTVKSFGNTKGLLIAFNDKMTTPYKIAKSKAMSTGFFQGMSQAIGLFVYGLVFYLAAVLQNVHRVAPEDVFTSIFAIVFAAVGLGQNGSLMPDMAKAKVAGANIFEIIESKDEKEKSEQEGGVVTEAIQGNIELRNVSFKYPSREKAVLDNLNINFEANKKIALVGSSGCGKSTIFQLLMRFYDVDSGSILIDGRDIKEYDLYYLRQQFGMVNQEPPLFTGTIEENIKYSHEASSDEIRRVAKVACVDKFIDSTANGYETEVGTKGGQLSGGQKQRVAIARCLLTKPNIVMFDESTSALDLETERALFENLAQELKGRTSIMIAHRIATITDSDKIIVMKDGNVVEQGNYAELTEQKGYFYRLERGQN